MRLLVMISLVLSIAIPTIGMTNKVLEVTDEFDSQYVGEYLETCEIFDERSSIKEIINARTWQIHTSPKIITNRLTTFLWIKLTVKNHTNIKQNLSLVLEDPLLEQIQFFCFEDGMLQDTSSKIGNAFPFNQRFIQHRFPIFAFQLTPTQDKIIYAALTKKSKYLPIHLKLYKQAFLFPALQKDLIYKSLLLSPILIFTITVFLVFIFNLRINSLLFALSNLVGLFLLLGLEGIGFQYLWPNELYLQSGFIALLLLYLFFLALNMLLTFKLNKKSVLSKFFYVVFIIQLATLSYIFHLSTKGTIYSFGGIKGEAYLLSISFISIYILLLIASIIYYKREKSKFLFSVIGLLSLQLFVWSLLSIGWYFGIHFQKYLTDFEILSILTNIQILAYLSIMILEAQRKETAYKKVEYQLTQKQNEALQNLLKGQENERKRLSSELHDGLNIRMLQVKQGLNAIKKDAGTDRFNSVIGEIDEIHQDIRNLSHALNPKVLQEYGLQKAINDIIFNIEINNPDLDIQFHYPSILLLSKEQEKHFYYILQELLNNTVKYANANYIYIEFRILKDRLLLYYFDNGNGYDPSNLSESGIGLRNIKSRVALLNGVFKIIPRKPKGIEHNIYVLHQSVIQSKTDHFSNRV